MHWKKRMMTPPPDESEKHEIITGEGASETLKGDIMFTDQGRAHATSRGWDELTLEEKCNRLGKWIGYIMDQKEKEA